MKVHGLGDSVMVRSLLEHFHRRHPDVEIGVLAGPANRDVLTAGADYQLHRSVTSATLSAGTILRTLADIRKRRYEAAIDFEQGIARPAPLLSARPGYRFAPGSCP